MSSGGAQSQGESGNISCKEGENNVNVDSESYCCYQNDKGQLDTAESRTCGDGTPFDLPDVESQLPTVTQERESPRRGNKNRRKKRHRSASVSGHSSRKDESDDVGAHSSFRRRSDNSPSSQKKNSRHESRRGAQGKPKKIASKESGDSVETPKPERDLGYRDKKHKLPKNTGKTLRGERNKKVSCEHVAEQPFCLVIKPPSVLHVNQDLITCYLKECLGDGVTFHYENAKLTGDGCLEFTFVFQNYEQGRRAEQLLKGNTIGEAGEKIEVYILSEETVTEMFLVECSTQLQKKMTLIAKQHAVKIEKISCHIKGLRVKKHIALHEFEKVCSERKALEHKKEELESQLQEFRRFDDYMRSTLDEQRGLPTSSVKSTVKKLREAFGRECRRIEAALPMYAKKTEITQLVQKNQVCVILGETGSGKSTQMTQYLYEAGFAEKGLIVCTQPRKVAATSLASHVAREMGSTVGKLVGCRAGGNVQASKETGIVYATDHILLNECLKDPKLSKYSCIIIDEAHERSLYSDLLLGMIKKSLIQRPELRVVITSATIDPALFVAYFDECPVLKVSGRMFPVDVIWKDGPSCNVENYLQEAVNTVQEIHHKEDQGDILVFLTSPAETERACEMLTKVLRDNNLICHPLHGKLRQEEQKKVFEENGQKRKVVFATNCAETSITIPGIKYVVDTGMVKEMKFEPKRNKSSLEVTTINKSSAEQRKGRAGRTQTGKCFRLYSQADYEAMEDQLKPEILRVHLGQAVLKLMELGIEDVRDFEFVQSPPLDSINLALESLNSLGAIANGKLTQLGGKIARVPVEPRLAKVIFEGIDNGVGADALALAAIATAGGCVFFRMGSEEEKQAADSRKVCFCMDGGDLLTLLEVYRQYLKQPKRLRERNKWAIANSLNAKSLRMTDETIKDLKLTLKHELKIRIPDMLQQDANNDVKLQKILLSCYATNLCMFTGHEKAGYKVLSSNQCVQVHPSSALKFLGATPQFIVFDQLLKTSREFVVNVTPVEETWLREMISTGALKYDLEHLLSNVLTETVLPCSSELMTLTFGGYRRQKLDQIEEKVSKSCDDSLVVLEEDKLRGQMKIFAPERYTVKALSTMGSILEEKREMLRSEEREEPLREEFPGCRIVWGRGGEIQEVLMQDMYKTVMVGEIDDGYEAAVKDHLKSFGAVVEHHSFKEQNGKIRVFVTYSKSQDALKAVKSSSYSSSLDIDIKVQPRYPTGVGNQTRFSQLKVRAKWLRRPCKGTGSIQFFNDEDFFYTLRRISSLVIRSRRVTFHADEIHEQQIFMRGLHPETSKEDVAFTIEDRLPSVKVMNVFIHRIAQFETEDETLVMQKTSLEATLGNFATQGNFSVYVGKPSSKFFEGYAILTFQNPEEGRDAIRGLNGAEIPGIGVVTLHPNLSTVLSCARNVYMVIEDEFNETISKLGSTFESNLIITVKSEPTDKRVRIEIQSNSTEHFICATTALTEIINGDKIDCTISKDLEILLMNSAKDVLQTIQKDTGTVISQDCKNQAVRIHGPKANRESAKRAINKFLDDFITGNSHPWQIQLRGPNKPRGLLKALHKRFGANLQGLRDIGGVQKINVEFRNHVLKIESSDEAEELINNCVAECCKNLSQEVLPLQQDHHTQLTCGICLYDLDTTADVYRLACCGHAYDKTCVIQQLKSPDFPLKCVVEQCGEPLVWKDLQNLLNDRERKSLALIALDEYVKRNPEIVKHCPTADCGMVYRVSTDGRLFACDACLAQTCTSCHMQWHNGLTCAMFKSEKQVEGRLMEWMMKDPSNRKNCPKCKTPIEKNEGCNHMTCSQCKTHMCWLCLRVFPAGDGVFDHQRHCPNKTAT